MAAAYRMAVIEYAKSFTKTFGEHSEHYLPNYHEIIFTSEQDSLHKYLLTLRKKVLAHSDIPILEPKVYLGEIAGEPFPLLIKNIAPSLPEHGEVKKLIETIINQLEQHISKYHQNLYID